MRVWDDYINDDDPRVRSEGGNSMVKDLTTLGVRPVVENVTEEVGPRPLTGATFRQQ